MNAICNISIVFNFLKDLKKFIEESEHGVIFISFGSMLKAASTPEDKVAAIVAAISELPQRVVWKWDEKVLPGNPKNVFLTSWLPQNDILGTYLNFRLQMQFKTYFDFLYFTLFQIILKL